MTSYQALINKIEAFYNDHLQVKKVGSDFNEQLPNFATKDERYPLVFITPIVASTTMDVNTISLEVYCLDIIQKDRANITVILSDCHQILVDLINYFNFSNDYSFDIVGSPSITPLNNQLLDYAAGWVMTLDVDISNWTNCQVPLKLPVVVGCETISVTYTLVGGEPVTVEVEKEGDEYTIEGVGTIEKVGSEWLVQTEETNCDNFINITFTYLGINYSYNVPFVNISGGKKRFYISGSVFIEVRYNAGSWVIFYINSVIPLSFTYSNPGDNDCPFYTSGWTPSGGSTIVTDLSIQLGVTTQSTLEEDTPCPFGDFTIRDGSIFSAFEVNPIL